MNIGEYSNIGFDVYINLVLFALCLGMCAAIIIVGIKRGTMAATVKQLMRHSAVSEDTAKTVAELNLKRTKILENLLSRDGQMKKIVHRVGEVKYTYEEYLALMKAKKLQPESVNFATARFYIKDDEMSRAKRIYESYSAPAFKIAANVILILSIYVCVSLLMPGIFDMINTMLA